MADSSLYTTVDDDYVDRIVWQWYGTSSPGLVERVYSANPGLAARGLRLPAGIAIELPEVEVSPAAPETVTLFSDG